MRAQRATPSARRRRGLALAGLSAASFVDGGEQQSLPVLWPYMQRSLAEASIGQLGPILGFSRLVTTLLLPLWGFVVDRVSRKKLLVFFTGFWGAWTLGLGLVHSVAGIYLVRMLSAIGLGVFFPAAFSLLGDLFSARIRGRTTGLMTSFSIIGTIGAFGVLPWIAGQDAEAWRWGFVAMGGASVVTGLFLLLIVEPPRGAGESELADVLPARTGTSRGGLGWRFAGHFSAQIRDLGRLWRLRSWRWLLGSEALNAASAGLFTGWVFTWFDGLDLGSRAFLVVGLMALSSILGAPLSGYLGDLLETRSPSFGRLSLILAGTVISLPSMILLVWLGNRGVSLWLLVVIGGTYGAAQAIAGTGVRWPIEQSVVAPEVRGSSRAFCRLAGGLVAALMLAVSGTLADALGIAPMLLILVPLPSVLNVLIWLPLFRSFPDDRARLHESLVRRREELLSRNPGPAGQE